MAWWFEAVLAVAPIIVILLAMVVFQRSAAVAGIIGLLLTVGVVVWYFSFPPLAAVHRTLWIGLIGSFAEAVFTAATILWIIFGALCLHQLQLQTGAIEALRHALGRLSSDPRLVAILIAWFFALFVEGAAGFGTSVALAAPFLVGFGFQPVQAVTIALVGHSVGVSFGAVGTPIIPQAAVTDWTGPQIAAVTGQYHALLGWVMLAFVLAVVTRTARAEGRSMVPITGWFCLGAAGFLVPMWAISQWVGPELPTMGGALIGGVLFVVALRLLRPSSGELSRLDSSLSDEFPVMEDAGTLLKATAPYVAVIVLILVTRLVGPVQGPLQSLVWEWELYGVFTGSFQPLYHPGTMLIGGFLLGGLAQGATRTQFAVATRAALKMLASVSAALIAMLAISRLMVHSAMIDALAGAASSLAGQWWPLFAPFAGALGTFVTGSATASNILFTDFQWATAEQLELDGLRLIGAQGFGAAVGNIIAPHNVIAGCATVGITGQEGAILRRTLGACALYAVLGGVLVWLFV